ncbi:PLP-dependent aminotransferase family protein [Acetonema longum]|uniref:GntR family transcriptional regulator n=1 Tax=Acetonema longum DSM 6540 TaxID=1009370 RepID=F7NJH4_9FIRM|nr:PLP-dependent aminotransferase family protein [Acetonema longum]EGO63804.1 GntR family transcriptional regulator [Acetonema longum DSM 6540]
MMIFINPDLSVPLYMQIYQEIKNKILSGELPSGYRLPSTRLLAATLAVARNTVESAYLQLTVEGYLVSRPGSGYIVQEILDLNVLSNSEPRQRDGNTDALNSNDDKQTFPYDFKYGHLNPDDFPMTLWKKLLIRALHELTADRLTMYGDPKGEQGLRDVISSYLKKSRGVLCEPDQIIVFAGTAYGLSVLSQLLKVHFQDIALEDPGYPIAREVFKQSGFKITAIDVEKDGLNISQLENSSARIVYVTPSHQFPCGVIMPIQKRYQLLNWAEKRDGIIIEDDYDSELRYKSRPIPSIASVEPNANVVYLGTLSKVLSPSLRISYIVLPKTLMTLYDSMYGLYPCSVSVIEQKALEIFMDSDQWESHLRKICASNKKRHDILIQAVAEILGDRVNILGENAGLHILLESTKEISEQDMMERAKQKGVLVYPVSPLWINRKNYSNNMVLLGFGDISETDIRNGIKQIRQAWD